jgi:putative transposase
MLFFLVHLVARRLLRAVAGRSSFAALEVENAVLRHQLAVLRRTVERPMLRRRERVLLAAASTLLPRERWSVFLVSPQTLAESAASEGSGLTRAYCGENAKATSSM